MARSESATNTVDLNKVDVTMDVEALSREDERPDVVAIVLHFLGDGLPRSYYRAMAPHEAVRFANRVLIEASRCLEAESASEKEARERREGEERRACRLPSRVDRL